MADPKANPAWRRLRREWRIARSALVRVGAAGVRTVAERPGRAAPPVAALLLVIGAAATGLQGLELLGEQRERQAVLRGEIERLEREAADLRARIAELETDPAALKLFAKTHHDLAEPGEVLVMLRFPERTGPPRPAREPAPPGYSIR